MAANLLLKAADNPFQNLILSQRGSSGGKANSEGFKESFT